LQTQERNERHTAVEDETNMAMSDYYNGVAEGAGLLGCDTVSTGK
jgi:hypothetical protein